MYTLTHCKNTLCSLLVHTVKSELPQRQYTGNQINTTWVRTCAATQVAAVNNNSDGSRGPSLSRGRGNPLKAGPDPTTVAPDAGVGKPTTRKVWLKLFLLYLSFRISASDSHFKCISRHKWQDVWRCDSCFWDQTRQLFWLDQIQRARERQRVRVRERKRERERERERESISQSVSQSVIQSVSQWVSV